MLFIVGCFLIRKLASAIWSPSLQVYSGLLGEVCYMLVCLFCETEWHRLQTIWSVSWKLYQACRLYRPEKEVVLVPFYPLTPFHFLY